MECVTVFRWFEPHEEGRNEGQYQEKIVIVLRDGVCNVSTQE